MKTALQVVATSIVGLVFLGVVLFLPAGTLRYWQAWVFIVVFTVATLVPSVYLAVNDPAALRRRMHAGPAAETRMTQKIAVTGVFAAGIAGMVVSGLDHRFGWSAVPIWLVIVGNVLVAFGLTMAEFVVIQNSYAAANVTVEEGQELVSSGLYSAVRHPMYVGGLIMSVGMPLALGSYWGLLTLVPAVALLAVRILDEEKALAHELPGYRDYMTDVRYRLVPHVW
jgi:protein-S-isoprenylcysteine O-methyltransferase Ste14